MDSVQQPALNAPESLPAAPTVGERAPAPEDRLAVGAVSVAAWVTGGATHVAQQLAGAVVGQLGDPAPVGPAGGPVEGGQAGHGAVPAQQFEELGVAEMAGGVLDLGEGVGLCHEAAR